MTLKNRGHPTTILTCYTDYFQEIGTGSRKYVSNLLLSFPRYYFDDPVENILNTHPIVIVDGSAESTPRFVEWLNNTRTQLESYVAGGGYLWLNSAPEPLMSIDFPFGVTLHPGARYYTDCAHGARYDAIFTHPEKVSCEYDGGNGGGVDEKRKRQYGTPFASGYLTFDGSFPNTEVLLVNKYDWDEIFLLRVRHGSGEVCDPSANCNPLFRYS